MATATALVQLLMTNLPDTSIHKSVVVGTPAQDQTRIAVIGLGGISKFFCNACDDNPNIRIVAACDIDKVRLKDFAAERPQVETFDDIESLLNEAAFDAAILDTPPSTHQGLLERLLDAKKHVCCEKPLTLSASSARDLVAVAQTSNVVLMTAFHRRYNVNAPADVPISRIGRVEAWYDEDIVEHAGSARWYFQDAANGGGCVMDNGPNALDSIIEVVGPLSMRAASIKRDGAGVDMQARLEGISQAGTPWSASLDWAAPIESKGMRIEYIDGSVEEFDFLRGFNGFKASLPHEYAGIVSDFAERLATGKGTDSQREPHVQELLEKALAIAEVESQISSKR